MSVYWVKLISICWVFVLDLLLSKVDVYINMCMIWFLTLENFLFGWEGNSNIFEEIYMKLFDRNFDLSSIYLSKYLV